MIAPQHDEPSRGQKRRSMNYISIKSALIANEAAPQTDEACGGCGSGRRLMTSFW
jgi:hypothetical protein